MGVPNGVPTRDAGSRHCHPCHTAPQAVIDVMDDDFTIVGCIHTVHGAWPGPGQPRGWKGRKIMHSHSAGVSLPHTRAKTEEDDNSIRQGTHGLSTEPEVRYSLLLFFVDSNLFISTTNLCGV